MALDPFSYLPGDGSGASATRSMAARPMASPQSPEAAEEDAQASPRGSVEALLGMRYTRLLTGMLLRSSLGTAAGTLYLKLVHHLSLIMWQA